MESQVAHEAGHMFGLPDEATKDIDVGTNEMISHYWKLVKTYFDMPFEQVDEDNLMSLGSRVKPRYHIPFIEALEKISPSLNWKTQAPWWAIAIPNLAELSVLWQRLV